jgi:hypothetical protein
MLMYAGVGIALLLSNAANGVWWAKRPGFHGIGFPMKPFYPECQCSLLPLVEGYEPFSKLFLVEFAYQ